MALSIRIKAVLPGMIFGVMLLAFLAMAHYATNRASGMTDRLAGRFAEIEDVRQIETGLSRLVLPHVEYLVNYDPAVRKSVESQFAALTEIAGRLRAMSVVNPEEHEFLHEIEKGVLAAQKTSNEFFALGPADHHRAMEILSDLSTRQVEPLTQSLQLWHEGELQQVQELKDSAQHEMDRITNWGAALLGAAVLAVAFAVWLNNNILVKPIISISRSASVLASGNLKEHVPVFYNDEIGRLAMSINSMAEALDDLYARMNLMANSDQLTGLFNRHAFNEVTEHELGAARRYGRHFALVMLDVDHFKKVNDTYGHSAGDAVLQFIAEQCKASVRDSDYCFRYGGEEFVLLLHENTSENALIAAERTRAAIEHGVCATHGQEIRITVSAGIACFPRAGTDIATLLQHADKALYAAKNAGRNRCFTYQDVEQEQDTTV
jgi:diguanylate cyclase (GGDEF)-like protein